MEVIPNILWNNTEGLLLLPEHFLIPLPTAWTLSCEHNFICWILLASLWLYCGTWNQVPPWKRLVAFSLLPPWEVLSFSQSTKCVRLWIQHWIRTVILDRGWDLVVAEFYFATSDDLLSLCEPWLQIQVVEMLFSKVFSSSKVFYFLKSISQYFLSGYLINTLGCHG